MIKLNMKPTPRRSKMTVRELRQKLFEIEDQDTEIRIFNAPQMSYDKIDSVERDKEDNLVLILIQKKASKAIEKTFEAMNENKCTKNFRCVYCDKISNCNLTK